MPPAYGFDEKSARLIADAVRDYKRRGRDVSGIPVNGVDRTPTFWMELTAESGGGLYSWKKVYPTPTGWADATPAVTGDGTAREVNATTGIPAGVRVEALFVGYASSAPRYLFKAAIVDVDYNASTHKLRVKYGGNTWVDKISFSPCP